MANLPAAHSLIITMHPFRDSEEESKLDSLESQGRLLWYSLGREEDPRTRQQLQDELARVNQLIKQLEPYERYHRLCEQEKKLRLLLEEAENTLARATAHHRSTLDERKELENVKTEYLKLVEQVKAGQEMEYKIEALEKEVGLIGEIARKVAQEDISSKYLDCIDYLKKNIMDSRAAAKRESEMLGKLVAQHNADIASQHGQWKKQLEEKSQVEAQLNLQRAQKLTLQTLRPASSQAASLGLGARADTFQVRRRLVTLNRVESREEVPKWYMAWSVILLLWLGWLLLARRGRVQPLDQVCY